MKLEINLNEDKELRAAVKDMVDAALKTMVRSEIENCINSEVERKMNCISAQYKIDNIANKIYNEFTTYTVNTIKKNIDNMINREVTKAVVDLVPALVDTEMKKVNVEDFAKELINAKIKAGLNIKLV